MLVNLIFITEKPRYKILRYSFFPVIDSKISVPSVSRTNLPRYKLFPIIKTRKSPETKHPRYKL